ncbi:hypothetical protein SH580_01085 [Coraliomargarita algicola]|uniref:PEP-CTERM protein-sorting domain-containing protein n=1 Tax=Coraliomargarita algicola TaxID=3092156 RepID=A0ABZ0RMS7_9BACT|nr:hypothetical protein [Coraliomargarita sp. J2-16]WPJ96295.1 hypothetical protein SH580_01085 [Coraliomargarita sp. J2-16]
MPKQKISNHTNLKKLQNMTTIPLKRNSLILSIGLSLSSFTSAGELVFYGGGTVGSPSFSATSYDSNLLDSASSVSGGPSTNFANLVSSADAPSNIDGTVESSEVPDFDYAGFNLFGTSIYNRSDFTTSGYFSFTLNVKDENSVQLESIEFRGGRSGDTTERGYRVEYSIDGGIFALAGQRIMEANTSPVPNQFMAERYTIIGTASSTVEFRFYGYIDGTAGQLRFDNIAVSAIPEPNSFTLISGLLALSWIAVRRGK